MGGFAFKDGRIRKKLTFDGVRFLMEHDLDLIPDLSIESITDRAAFSSLGKAGVVLSGGVVLLELRFSPWRAPLLEPFGGVHAGAWHLHSGVLCSVVIQAPEHR